MGIFRKREGFVTKGNRQIQNSDTPGAQQTIIKGLDHYSNQILEALNGYPADDARIDRCKPQKSGRRYPETESCK